MSNLKPNNLKNRISPDFLFDKLHQAAEYCLTEPSYTSRILLKLSHILRYQLYDSSREKALLSAEVKYLNNYLTLEKECNNKFDFKIIYPESTINYLIPTSLLISFIEDSLKMLSTKNSDTWINIDFKIIDNILTFIVTDNREILNNPKEINEYTSIYRRLHLIPNQENYSVSSRIDKYQNQYKTIFQCRL